MLIPLEGRCIKMLLTTHRGCSEVQFLPWESVLMGGSVGWGNCLQVRREEVVPEEGCSLGPSPFFADGADGGVGKQRRQILSPGMGQAPPPA